MLVGRDSRDSRFNRVSSWLSFHCFPMDKCAGLLSCKCLRPSPYKKCVKNLYPPGASGYEENLEAQNADELAKLALRNENLFIPISK